MQADDAELERAERAMEKLDAAIERALAVLPAPVVLAALTDYFVDSWVEAVRRKGLDPSKEIKLDGGGQRSITIHAVR